MAKRKNREAIFIKEIVRPFFEKQIGPNGICHKLQDAHVGESWNVQNPKPADLMLMWLPGTKIDLPRDACVCLRYRYYESGFGLVEAKAKTGLTISIDDLSQSQINALSKAAKCGHMSLIAVQFEAKATKKLSAVKFHKYIEYRELEQAGSISFNRDGSVQ